MRIQQLLSAIRVLPWAAVLLACPNLSAVSLLRLVASTQGTTAGQTLSAISPPSINNQQQVAYVATFNGGNGVFIGGQLVIQTGQPVNRFTHILTLSLESAPSLNNLGHVSFWATYGTSYPSFLSYQGIFVNNQLRAYQGQSPNGTAFVAFETKTSLNDSDEVAFLPLQAIPGSNVPLAIFTSSGPGQLASAISYIVRNFPEPIPPFIGPSLNNGGVVAGAVGSGIQTKGGLLAEETYDMTCGCVLDGLSDPYAMPAYADSPAGSNPSLNNNGELTFGAPIVHLDPQQQRVLAGQGIYRQSIYGSSGPTLVARDGMVINGTLTLTSLASNKENLTNGAMGDPVINGRGTIAFAADYRDGTGTGTGIFTQYGVVAKTGDHIAFSDKVIAWASNPAINDWGDIAFYAHFTDGTDGVVAFEHNGGPIPCPLCPFL